MARLSLVQDCAAGWERRPVVADDHHKRVVNYSAISSQKVVLKAES
jgi:hypothetical protein